MREILSFLATFGVVEICLLERVYLLSSSKKATIWITKFSSCINHSWKTMGEVSIDHGSEAGLRSFLVSMLSQYEVLVEDMQSELTTKCQETRRMVLDSHNADLGLSSDTNLDASIDVRDAMITNLQGQVELHSRSEELLRTLVKLAVEQIDLLETVKPREVQSATHTTIHPDVFSRLKQLNDYSLSMKEQCVHLARQAEMYQKTMAEMKTQYNAMLRKLEANHASEMNNLSQVTQTELHHAKHEVQKLGKQFEYQLKKRLSEEKSNWEYQESRTLTLLRAQIDELLLELATFAARERDLVVQVEELRLENTMLQDRLRSALCDISEASVQFKEAFEARNFRLKNNANNIQRVIKSSSSATQTEENQQTVEAVHARYKERLQQLETESKKLQESLRQSETHSSEQAEWLQRRIAQLNELNRALTEQFRELSEKYDTVCRSTNVQKDEKGVQATDNRSDRVVEKEEPDKRKEKVADKMLPLTLEIFRMQAERKELTELLDKQMRIASKWKQEFKNLVKRTKLESSC